MAQMKRTYTNFAGGQNNHAGQAAGPVILDSGTDSLFFAHVAQNWQMSENGLIKYPGDDDVLESALSGSPVITGLTDFNGVLILCAGTKIYTVNGATATEIYDGVSAGAYFQFTQWDDGAGTEILILCNGVDAPLYYDGDTCIPVVYSDPDTIWNNATPKGAAVFRGRVFYWGDPLKPHRIYTPRPGTHNNFDNTQSSVDAFDIDAGFGGKITGVRSLTDDLLVIYKQQAIRRLSGITPFGSDMEPFIVSPVTDDFGCIAPRTIVQVGVEHYFLSEDGLRRLKPIESYGDIDPQQPTYPIQDRINDLNYDGSVIENACAVFHKHARQIWLSLPEGASTNNNWVLIHNVMTGGNDPRGADDITASTLVLFNRKIYHGDYAGQIYQHGDTYSYHGQNIAASWESKWIAHDGLGLRKCYRELHIFAESDGAGDLVVQWSVLNRGNEKTDSLTQNISSGDNAWDSALWDTAIWAAGEQNVFKIKNLGRGNALKLKFINQTGSQRVKIRQVDLYYDILNTSRG